MPTNRYTVELAAGDGAAAPLFCLPPALGEVTFMRWLFETARLDRPVVGLRAFGLDREREPLTDIPTMARRFVDVVRRIQPAGPYSLAGYCFGGDLAHEIAAQLIDEGEQVAFLGLLGLSSASPALVAGGLAAIRGNRLSEMVHICRAGGFEIAEDDPDSPDFLAGVLVAWKELGRLGPNAVIADLEALLQVYATNILAMDKYEKPRIPVTVNVFLPSDHADEFDEAGFASVYEGCQVHPVAATHDAMPHSSSVAAQIRAALAEGAGPPRAQCGPRASSASLPT